MFTDHETFIIALSVAKAHIAVAPETEAIARSAARSKRQGTHTQREYFESNGLIRWITI